MKRKGIVICSMGIAAVVAGGFGAWAWRRHAAENAAWAAAHPARPNLAKWPAEFRARVEAAEVGLGDKREAEALGELARLYHANGFLREAEQAYRGLLSFDPTEARWPHLLASLLAGYGRLEDAIQFERRAVELAPEYLPARLRLGDAWMKANQRDAAEATYREVLARAPDNVYALLGLARIDLANERLTAAREKLTRAAAADPKFFGAQSLLASVFERLGNDQGAAVARARASAAGRFREMPDPWVDGLTQYCYDVYRLQVAAATEKASGDIATAARLLERALTFAPEDGRTLRQLGDCQRELGNLAAARAHLEKAIALAPAEARTYLDLVEVHLAAKDNDAVFRTLEKALDRCIEKADLHYQMGVALLGTRRLAEAVPHLAEAVKLSPENPNPAHELVTTLFELGREVEAGAALETAVVRFPESAPVLLLAARHRIVNGNAEEATRLLGRAERAGASPGELAGLAGEFRRKFGREP